MTRVDGSGDPPAKPINTRAQIRRLALKGALATWAVYSLLGWFYRGDLRQAISCGAAASIGGLAGWAAYHVASRRADGLLYLSMYITPVVKEGYTPFLRAVVIGIVALASIGFIVGFIIRLLPGQGGDAGPVSP